MSVAQWETYYQGGALATGPAGADGLYDLEVREAWERFFAQVPSEARLLDVGTGNGVIALIAQQVAQKRSARWAIDATDLARIDPRRTVVDGHRRFAGITFHAETATESLPFDASCFDAVSGHYAIEYCDLTLAFPELQRVMKPGGLAQFVIHHSDSVLLRLARRAEADATFLLDDIEIYRHLHDVVVMEGSTPSGLQEATAQLVSAIRALKDAYAEAQRTHPGSARMLAVAIDAVPKLLDARRRLAASDAGLEVRRAESEIRDARARVQDLMAHAIDEEGLDRAVRIANAAGFELRERALLRHAGENLIGFQLVLWRQ